VWLVLQKLNHIRNEQQALELQKRAQEAEALKAGKLKRSASDITDKQSLPSKDMVITVSSELPEAKPVKMNGQGMANGNRRTKGGYAPLMNQPDMDDDDDGRTAEASVSRSHRAQV